MIVVKGPLLSPVLPRLICILIPTKGFRGQARIWEDENRVGDGHTFIFYYICVSFLITEYKSLNGKVKFRKLNFDQPLCCFYLRTKCLDFQYEFLFKYYLIVLCFEKMDKCSILSNMV